MIFSGLYFLFYLSLFYLPIFYIIYFSPLLFYFSLFYEMHENSWDPLDNFVRFVRHASSSQILFLPRTLNLFSKKRGSPKILLRLKSATRIFTLKPCMIKYRSVNMSSNIFHSPSGNQAQERVYQCSYFYSLSSTTKGKVK